MSGRFSLGEVAAATAGTLERGLADTPIAGVSMDSRKIAPGDLFVALPGKNHDAREFASEASARGAVAILCAPGGPPIPPTLGLVRVENPETALWDLAVFHRRRLAACVVGITGSCGKTTTKEMIGRVLETSHATVRAKASHNNHIGLPLTILSAELDTEFLILELGTSSPGEIARLCSLARPHWGVVTAIGPAHLEGLGTVEQVFEEKAALARALPVQGRLFLPAEASWAADMAELAACPAVRVTTVGRAESADQVSGGWGSILTWQGRPVRVPVPGRPGIQAAALALAIAEEADVDPALAAKALAAYRPAEGRMEARWVAEVLLVNDAYNANPDSVAAALDVLSGLAGVKRRIAVLGPMAELGPQSARYHRAVGRRAAASRLDLLVTVGSETLPMALEAMHRGVRVVRTPNVEDAVTALLPELQAGDVVLIKGSHSVGLDKAVALIEAQLKGEQTKPKKRSAAG